VEAVAKLEEPPKNYWGRRNLRCRSTIHREAPKNYVGRFAFAQSAAKLCGPPKNWESRRKTIWAAVFSGAAHNLRTGAEELREAFWFRAGRRKSAQAVEKFGEPS
jgi:hypothetical protein